jgi:SAM domain (Sterile alpha motif)
MSEYVRRFAENDIDASVLPYLTDQSLKELGVSLGHRLKILAAIRSFAVRRLDEQVSPHRSRSLKTLQSAAKSP